MRASFRRTWPLLAVAACTVIAAGVHARDDAGDLMRRARREAADGRYAQAESSYARAAAAARGEQRAEALFSQAGLMPSARNASAVYERLVADPDAGEWSGRAALELAKIHFAVGRYEAAYQLLNDARAQGDSDDAALFEGLSALMAGDYEQAIGPLERIRRGKNRTWAVMAMAEADAGAGRNAEACRLYESLARARVNPAAWYRYAECLEAGGDGLRAREQYSALADAYPQTPEAIRCAGKLSAAQEPPAPAPREEAEQKPVPPGKGFTIQFGSFTDRGNAIRLATRVKQVYPGVRIDSELVNYREVFRVRFGYYASRDEADAVGKEMAERLDERFTVMPVRPNP